MRGHPLEGIRVADFSWQVAGPHCAQWLGVLGAEVIKIESHVRPESFRMGAPYADGQPGLNRTANYNSYNYSKLSCSLNLTQPRAREIAREIVRISDVVVENYSYGIMEGFGLGYQDLKKLKPDIIMLSSSGLGRTGPLKEYVAHGPAMIPYFGLSSLTGYPGESPARVGATWPDPMSAVTNTFAVLSALYHRSQTGEGQYIDGSQSEASLVALPEAILDYTMNGRVGSPRANRDDLMAPHNCYPCKGEDKWVAIAVSTDEEWEALCGVMGNPEWARDEKFADGLGRWNNQEELDQHIGEWTRNHTHYEVMEILQRVGVAAGPSVNMEELIHDPHLRERGFFIELDHVEVGRRLMAGMPWRVGNPPGGNYTPTPALGQHNHYVLHHLLGISEEEIQRLTEENVVN